MAQSQALEVQQKKEMSSKEEQTVPSRDFVPHTDIFETEEGLVVVMEIPGVDKEAVEVRLENDTLRIEGRIDYGNYEGLEPLYAEYNIGHFACAFTLSNKIDQGEISAQLADGVLTLTLKKTKGATPRRIDIN